MKPKLTIAIPTYRRPDLLAEALKSAINQKTEYDYEILVVDNECERSWSDKVDGVISSVNSNKLIFMRNEKNLGMVGNWNKCIELCNSEWVSILNDDDLLSENFVEHMLRTISNKPGYGMYVSRKNILDQRKINLKIAVRKVLDYLKSLRDGLFQCIFDGRKLTIKNYLRRNETGNSLCAVFSKEAALAIGKFKEEYYPSFDYKFNADMVLKYGIYECYRRLGSWRVLANETLNYDTFLKFATADKKIKNEIKDHLKYLN